MTWEAKTSGGLATRPERSQLEQSLMTFRDNLGLANVAYLSRSAISSVAPPTFILTFPEEWVERYLALIEIDPVVKIEWREDFPVDWRDIDRTSPEVKAFFEDAERHGIGSNGLTFPLRSTGGERAIFTITSDTDRSTWEKMQWSKIRKIKRFAEMFHQRTIILKSGQNATLSQRETECLRHLMEGSTPKTAAGLLGVSENRVRTVLKQACMKLDCRTPTQAVAKALRLGLLW